MDFESLFNSLPYFIVMLLFLVGLFGIFSCPNLLRKLMAMNILQVSVIVFYILLAAKNDSKPPIFTETAEIDPSLYSNPLPHTLMLTAIVVGVSTTGVALALLLRIYRRYGTLDEKELLRRMEK